jgi:hypothetical protein
MTDTNTVTDQVERYFVLAADPDLDAYFAQFADDAVAEDEGNLYRGIDAIRAWRTTVPDVSYRVVSIEPADDGQVAVAEIAGDFPGSPVSLAFGFTFRDEKIQTLTIRPTE